MKLGYSGYMGVLFSLRGKTIPLRKRSSRKTIPPYSRWRDFW